MLPHSFFAFTAAIRKINDANNAVESLNRVLRKTRKTKGSSSRPRSPPRSFLAVGNFEKGGRAIFEWVAARNRPAIMFAERFGAWPYLKTA